MRGMTASALWPRASLALGLAAAAISGAVVLERGFPHAGGS
jgi:hypothetical protein